MQKPLFKDFSGLLTYDAELDASIGRAMGWAESRYFSPSVWQAIQDKKRIAEIGSEFSKSAMTIAPGDFPVRRKNLAARIFRGLSFRGS